MHSDRFGLASCPDAASTEMDRPQGACEPANRTILDQRTFQVSGDQYQALLDLLDRPARDNPGLSDLFSRPDPWELG